VTQSGGVWPWLDFSDPAVFLFMSVTLSFLSFLFIFIYLCNKNKLFLWTVCMQVILSTLIVVRVLFVDPEMPFSTFILILNILLGGLIVFLFKDRKNIPAAKED
jgi:hypothetical protein